MVARRNRRLSGASALADVSSDEEEDVQDVPKAKPKPRRRLSSGAALMASDSDEEAPKAKPKARRRLSSGAALMATDSEDDDAPAKPKKKTNRRRSGVASRRSFGKAALARTAAVDMSADEVAAMYSKTIKMATEGKINAKNAWNLPLIDHMRDVVGGEASKDKTKPQRAVNFQKASCTIEAGMKIYCSRVDDTLSTSYRVLESLHRGKDDADDDEEVEEENDNDDEATKQKKARKKKERRRGAAASTLATLDQIDAADVDEAATDVLFSRLSRSGGGGLTDGTSARAMLLLRLAAESGCVSFGDSGAIRDSQDDAVVHVQPLRDLLPSTMTEFCPALSALRREVEDGAPAEVVQDDEGGFLAGADDDDDGCQFDDHDDAGGDLEGALDAALNDTAGGLGAKCAVHGELDATAAFALVSGALARAGDAKFFDAARLAARNAWAGAAHWKAAARPKAAAPDGPAKKKKRTQAKRESDLDFGGPPPAVDALAPPPPKRGGADPLALGPAALQRLHAGARDMVLPPDLRVTPGQLRRLFLLEDVAVAAAVKDGAAALDGLGDGYGAQDSDDDFGGFGSDEENDENADRFAIPDDPMTPGFNKGRPSIMPTPGRASFGGADGPDLLACGRKVDKVQIAYATRAKKVDVRKLKAQMWRDVEAQPASDFAQVVNRVGAQQHQKDVTMPFYFICLLHLCNEKTLSLEADGLKNFAVATEG